MQLLDYLPAFLALTFAALGVIARTKDDSRSGIHRITRAGWLFLFLSATAFCYGAYAIQETHIKKSKRDVIAHIARDRIVDGINLMLKPLCGVDRVFDEAEIGTTFKAVRSIENLSKVGKKRSVIWQGTGGYLVQRSNLVPFQAFEEPYELYDFYVSEGRKTVTATLSYFGTYLSEDELIAVSKLLADAFLNGDYNLSGKTTFFLMGLEDEKTTRHKSPWNTLGLHYFDAIYEGSTAREGNTMPASEFLSKAEAAIVVIAARRTQPLNFKPCTR